MMEERLLQRVDELIGMGNAVLQTRRPGGSEARYHSVDEGLRKGFRAASLSFIASVYGKTHSHFTEFREIEEVNYAYHVQEGLGIMKAIRGEITGDWLFTVKGLLTAEVFADYMEMAEHLLDSGYKDPAAVIAGSTLEEHLRQLCTKNGIPITEQKNGKDVPLKADRLNSNLVAPAVYSKLDQKQVTAWLDLRNKAAHGEYGEYNADQVKGMITGITEFMARVAV